MRKISLLLMIVSAVLALAGCDTYPRPMVSTSSNTIIVTRAPAPKEVIVVPRGSYKCFKVEGGWYNNVWVPTHKVCKYHHARNGHEMWVSGYWQCDSFSGSTCNNWSWVSGHWTTYHSVY